MKKLCVLFTLLLLAVQSKAQIQFEHLGKDWGDILEKAEKADKPIFVDVYTDWCRPCKVMDKEMFPKKSVGKFFNASYINVKANVTKGKPAIWLRDSFNVNNFPTLLYFNHKGELLHETIGAPFDADALIKMGRQALDPNKQYFTLMKRFEQGERGIAFIENLINAELDAFADSRCEVPKSFFQEIPEEQRTDAKYWGIWERAVYSSSSPFLAKIIERKEEFVSEVGQDKVYGHLRKIFSSGTRRLRSSIAYRLDIKNMEAVENLDLIADILDRKPKMAPIHLYHLGSDTVDFDFDRYAQLATDFSKVEYHPYFGVLYNSVAWNIVSQTQDDKLLAVAEKLVDFALKDLDDAYIKDTKACILYQQGQVQEAIALQQEAIQQAKDNEDPEESILSLEDTLTKMTNQQELF